MLKMDKCITLIASVITIVVLLILARVSISSAVKVDKISRGDTSEITSSELQAEMNKYTDEVTVAGDNYFIDNEGKVHTWGNDSWGLLGDGSVSGRDMPVYPNQIVYYEKE